ncbi:MAG: dTDP-4-amino-4,6-dideoxygalactose transaminase, partial [Candidatus Omnitrophica bacterium CG11_big_fil_rev_8_21_14_0_20_63_9]
AKVRVIEDAAQAFGSSWRSRPLGTLGDVGCLSFHGTKNVTCGEGGALITRDDAVARRALLIREKGTNREAFRNHEVDRYTWVDTGGSFVLSDLLAAVLLAQLRRMETIAQARAAIAARYLDALQPLSAAGRLCLPVAQDRSTVNWHLFYVLLPTKEERDQVLRGLREAGIEAAFHFVPLHSSPYAQRQYGYRPGDLPVTEDIAQRLIRLPIYPGLTPEEQEMIITTFLQLVR